MRKNLSIDILRLRVTVNRMICHKKKVIDIKKKPNFDFDQILIQNLSFNHKDSKVNLLKNVNIEISKGQLIEIVGESGSGKSTLLNLILGLLKPIDGRIYFKNQKISSTDSNWKNHFSFVPQESIIIDETIANNIAIGVIDIKKDNSKLSYSMTASGLNKFLDKSLNYSLGEGGSRLSGGENQRIGISRAIYRDTPVIVMDEPTASLDQKNQDKIVETINHIKNNQKKTIIIVSHKKLNGLQIDKTYNISNGIVSELKTNLK